MTGLYDVVEAIRNLHGTLREINNRLGSIERLLRAQYEPPEVECPECEPGSGF